MVNVCLDLTTRLTNVRNEPTLCCLRTKQSKYRRPRCRRVLPAARDRRWIELTVEEQRSYVMRLLDALEVTDRDKRLKVARAILYLAQGA